MYTYMVSDKGKYDKISTDELACIYAALVLCDDDIPVTADKISTLLNAANVSVENIWPSMYAKALAGINIRQYIMANFSAASGGEGPDGAAATKTTAKTDDTPVQDEKKVVEEEEEDSDEDMGLGLFD